MKRMLVILAVFACVTLRAGDFAPAAPQTAAEVLAAFDDVQARSGKFTADFVQTRRTSLLEKDMVSRGRLTMNAPEWLVWEYLSPEKSSRKVDLSADARYAAIGRKADFSREVFSGDGCWKIVLTPLKRDLKRLMAVVEVVVDAATMDVRSAKMTEPSGDYTLIEFKNVER